jgi:hypothetical protein
MRGVEVVDFHRHKVVEATLLLGKVFQGELLGFRLSLAVTGYRRTMGVDTDITRGFDNSPFKIDNTAGRRYRNRAAYSGTERAAGISSIWKLTYIPQ